MPDVCSSCTEEVNTNYTLHTGDAYICGPDGATRDLGNVQVGRFGFNPNVIEHRRGKDGSLDAIVPVSEDFQMELVLEELTPANVSFLLGQDMVNTANGCEIALDTPECGRDYAFQFVHTFPCEAKTLQIDFWRALILSPFTMEFGESLLNYPLIVRALKCDSIHPSQPYGRMVFNVACPAGS